MGTVDFPPGPIQTPIKMACIELCGGVQTAPISTQIPIGFCTHFIGHFHCKQGTVSKSKQSYHWSLTKKASQNVISVGFLKKKYTPPHVPNSHEQTNVQFVPSPDISMNSHFLYNGQVSVVDSYSNRRRS